MMMTTSIGGITAPLSAAAQAAGAASIFYTIIDAPQPNTSGLKEPDVSAAEDIVLEHVNFAYPTRPDLKVLDDVSLRFPAGKMTAIVGPYGSGKSTIVSLIERWYELDGDAMLTPEVSGRITGAANNAGGVKASETDVEGIKTQADVLLTSRSSGSATGSSARAATS